MIRKATAAEAASIAALVSKAYRPAPDERGWTHESDLVSGARIGADQVAELMAGAGSILVASEGPQPRRRRVGPPAGDEETWGGPAFPHENNVLIGCVQIEPTGDDCTIGMLATNASHQNQGLGRMLLVAAEAFATEHYGATRYRMTVLSSRPDLQVLELHKRAGDAASDAER